MKNKFFILTLLLISGKTFGQNLSGGIDFGLFNYTLSESKIIMTGFTMYGKYIINDRIGIGLSYSRYSRTLTNPGFASVNYSFSPILLTLNYKLYDEDFSPYVGFDIGNYDLKVSIFNSNYLGVSPKIGAIYKLSDNFDFIANVQYHYILSPKSSYAENLNLGCIYKF